MKFFVWFLLNYMFINKMFNNIYDVILSNEIWKWQQTNYEIKSIEILIKQE